MDSLKIMAEFEGKICFSHRSTSAGSVGLDFDGWMDLKIWKRWILEDGSGERWEDSDRRGMRRVVGDHL